MINFNVTPYDLKNKKQLFFWLAILAFIAYSFVKINYGISMYDEGYNLSNYMYVEQMDPMWFFSTYLSNVVGHIITLLPKGNTLLGARCYTTCIMLIMVIILFVLLVKALKYNIGTAFIGLVIAISLRFCSTMSLYNYLTYFFLNIGGLLLYIAISDDKKILYVLAGICLGLNVMVRFPNITEISLILLVWYACFLKGDNFKQYLSKTGLCVLGYLLGAGSVLIQISFRYGFRSFIVAILRLFQMSEEAADYSVQSMLDTCIAAYREMGRTVFKLLPIVVTGIVIYYILEERYRIHKRIVLVVLSIFTVYIFYKKGLYVIEYTSADSVIFWIKLAIGASLLTAIYQIFKPGYSTEKKVFALFILLLSLNLLLGTNTGLYSCFNNMFLFIPYLLHNMYAIRQSRNCEKSKRGGYTIESLKIIGLVFSTVLAIQSVGYYCNKVINNAVMGDCKITSIPVLEGVYTSSENARALEGLGEYVARAKLSGRYLLSWGNISGMSAYLEMPFLMTPWVDLYSYSKSSFTEAFEEVVVNVELNRPVIIMQSGYRDAMFEVYQGKKKEDYEDNAYWYKGAAIFEFLKEYKYTCTFENEAYVIFE